MRWLLVTRHALLRCRSRHCEQRQFSSSLLRLRDAEKPNPIDASLGDLGLVIKDDYANFQDHYQVPKHPIVLAHGLMGFSELRLAGSLLPGVQYWRGIKEAYEKNGIEPIMTTVPMTGSIKQRAEALHQEIQGRLGGEHKDVNIIAHSMGGLDSRYLISQIKPTEFKIRSLTTIATPHRGSSAADIVLREIGPDYWPQLSKVLARFHIETAAFTQLTRKYITEEFNPLCPDDPDVRYFSYGASATPSIFSVFRLSHDLIEELEGPNDGLVSVASSRWGEVRDGYKGTLMGVTHLDLINWTNRLKLLAARLGLHKQNFNAVALYLAVADMLASEGL